MTPPNDAPMPDVIYAVAGNLTTINSEGELITGLWVSGSMFDPNCKGTPPVRYTRSPRTPAAKAEAQRALDKLPASDTHTGSQNDIYVWFQLNETLLRALLERECK